VPIPDYQSLMSPLLEIASDGAEHTLAELRTQLSARLALSESDLAERISSGTQTVFWNRVAWAVQYLKAAHAIEPVRRATYRITDRGRSLLVSGEVRVKALRQFPEFAEFAGKGSVDPASDQEVISPSDIQASDSSETPEESLDRNFRLHRDALAAELLESVRNGSPAAFERLVVELLVAMGYGGTDAGAGEVVGKSGDGGIDGIIKQDKLGLDSIYIQAKRWRGNVGSPEIMQFSGGLTKRHATRGVVITPSGFSKDAKEYVQSLPQNIILVDGPQLASLMIEYGVGVVSDKTYTLKQVNPSYFENL
jgi:restriction system protein